MKGALRGSAAASSSLATPTHPITPLHAYLSPASRIPPFYLLLLLVAAIIFLVVISTHPHERTVIRLDNDDDESVLQQAWRLSEKLASRGGTQRTCSNPANDNRYNAKLSGWSTVATRGRRWSLLHDSASSCSSKL